MRDGVAGHLRCVHVAFFVFRRLSFSFESFLVIMVLLVHTKSHLFGISDLVDISVVHAFFLFLANLFHLG